MSSEVPTQGSGRTEHDIFHGVTMGFGVFRRDLRPPSGWTAPLWDRSLLDRAHSVPNLFVVDGSFMPTSGAAAPTLTIVAASFRTADHIVAQARRGEL